MLTVHHLRESQSDRIPWLCEELAIPYELVLYNRDPITRLAPAEYKKLHPFGTAPIITDGDLALGESGAVLEYICARYGNGRLSLKLGDPGYTDFLYWLHFANGSMMPAMSIDVTIDLMGGMKDAVEVLRSMKSRSKLVFEVADRHLANNEYFAGSVFSIADINMMFPLTTMRMYTRVELGPYPRIRAYLQRIGARQAYQRAMAKAEPGTAPFLT